MSRTVRSKRLSPAELCRRGRHAAQSSILAAGWASPKRRRPTPPRPRRPSPLAPPGALSRIRSTRRAIDRRAARACLSRGFHFVPLDALSAVAAHAASWLADGQARLRFIRCCLGSRNGSVDTFVAGSTCELPGGLCLEYGDGARIDGDDPTAFGVLGLAEHHIAGDGDEGAPDGEPASSAPRRRAISATEDAFGWCDIRGRAFRARRLRSTRGSAATSVASSRRIGHLADARVGHTAPFRTGLQPDVPARGPWSDYSKRPGPSRATPTPLRRSDSPPPTTPAAPVGVRLKSRPGSRNNAREGASP